MAIKNNKNPIHGATRLGFLERRSFVEAVSNGPPILMALGAAGKLYFTEPATTVEGWLILLSLAACAWLLVAAVVKVQHAKAQDAVAEAQRSHDGLKAALFVLHSVICHAAKCSAEHNGTVRVTFHRVLPPFDKCEEIEQIVPYVGDNSKLDGGLGRRFSIRSGITGATIRTHDPHVMSRQADEPEAYKAELIKEWSYTKEDVEKLTMDRYSAFSVPILDRSGLHVLGVVYLDSSNKEMFSSESMQLLVVAACAGISSYSSERYST